MKPLLGFGSIAAASAIVVMAAQPGLAAPTEITGIDVRQTSGGIALELKTRFGDRPQVFSAPRGNSWVADVINTQLNLPGGAVFQQDNPASGIASVQVIPLDSNSVRVIVTGTDTLPAGEVSERSSSVLSFNVTADSGVAAQPDDVIIQQPAIAQQATPPFQPAEPVDVLIPNPKVSIDGAPAERLDPAPPFLPRAVAPPVGDIATSEIAFQSSSVDLGTAVRIPRLVLREAPAREVLSLLSRAAGLNLAFNPNADGESSSRSGAEGDEGPRISLDVENEPVQDVFNAVLRLSGLEGNRVNNTIFVSPELPNSLKDIVVRTYRLNQVTADQASAFLASMGAERVISATVRETEVESLDIGDAENAPSLTQTNTVEKTTLESERIELEDSKPILRGMQVLADPRTNAVTIVGPRNLVAIASTKITELDLRKRQVAVNVRVLDVNLNNANTSGSSFSFGVAGNSFLSNGGFSLFNFDASGGFDQVNNGIVDERNRLPGSFQAAAGGLSGFSQGSVSEIAQDFVAQLQANVQNGNAKVLTDPTLVVQEGQTASVQLTEEVVTNVTVEREVTDGVITSTTTFEKEEAGLNLAIQVDRIDDNGFITMSVSPNIKGIADTFTARDASGAGINAILLSERNLSSGNVRLRDGQGLILSGIIQDSDRVTVSKTPVFGDLPIIGSLFRSTTRTTDRNELIVLVTPQILDDSDRSTFGYSYVPSSEARRALESNVPDLR